MSRLLAWITSFLLLFFVLEVIVRLTTSSPATEPDPRMGWVYKESVHQTRSIAGGGTWDFRTNSDRLRAPEGHGTGAKNTNETRVLILGDSFTMGWALEADETFASQFEQMCAGRNVTVIPAGTEGYYTDQACLWLESHIQKYQPDIVIICPYANDVVGNSLPKYLATNKPLFEIGANGEITNPPKPVEDGRAFYLKFSRFISQINTMRLGFGSLVKVPENAGGGMLQLDDFAFLSKETPETIAGWRATAAIAKRMVTKAKEGGAKHIFAAPIPNKFEIHRGDGTPFEIRSRAAAGSFDFSKVTEQLGRVFSEAGATLIDARPALFTAAASERVYYENPGEWHFNKAGAKVFATSLFQNITKANALPAAAAQPAAGPFGLALAAKHHNTGGIPTWAFVVAGLWVVLSLGFKYAYPDENPALAFVKVGILLTFVVGVFAGIGFITSNLPGIGKFALFAIIFIAIGTYALYKTAPRFGTIRELFGALVDRGHWYLVPMLVVMLTISVLLVVAQNPIVAPFIYTLF
ncbi:MAG: DUF5989 family protein [Planctomycetota bacterium]